MERFSEGTVISESIEREDTYRSWSDLFASSDTLKRARVLFLAAVGWAAMEATDVHAENLRVREHNKKVTIEFDQKSTDPKSKDRAHVTLNYIDDFRSTSSVKEDVPTTSIAQFLPNLYEGEHLKAEDAKGEKAIKSSSRRIVNFFSRPSWSRMSQ